MLSFGQRLKLIRKEAQVTQAELAEKLMVSVQAISKWECDTSMPDISLLVPLAAILGVTCNCLLGVGGDEKADREKLEEAVMKVQERGNWYTYENNCDYICYELYRDHVKKYPLDYSAKYGCAAHIFGFLDDSVNGARYIIPKEEEEKLFEEATQHLNAILNYDKNTTRLIDTKSLLICLHLYRYDFAKAEVIAEDLPEMGNIRNSMLLEIYDRKKDYEKCIEVSKDMCDESMHSYLDCLWVRARRISIFGNARKKEALNAWYDFLDAAKLNHRIFNNGTSMDMQRLAYANISNDYIAISEFDNALTAIEELCEFGFTCYEEFKAKGFAPAVLKEIVNDFKISLRKSYCLCFPTSDNIIANDPRFKKCEERLAALG